MIFCPCCSKVKFPFQKMLLHLLAALLAEEKGLIGGESDQSTAACVEDEICQACINADIRYPYWNGQQCVSCSVGSPYDAPYLDVTTGYCTSECEGLIDKDNVCRPCPDDKPYFDWDSSSCKSCEEVYFGTRNFWSPMFEDCVEECPEGFAPDKGYTCKTCEALYPDTPHWDVYEQKCIKCPKDRDEYASICRSCEESYSDRPYWDEKEE